MNKNIQPLDATTKRTASAKKQS